MKRIFAFAAASLALAACQSTLDPVEERMAINFSIGVTTKVTDNAFDNGDKAGIYVVHWSNEPYQENEILTSGNYYDNVEYTYQDGWQGETMYWYDKHTPADFYCYYPYAEISDINSHDFCVADDQSNLQNLKNSDFVWGKAREVAPGTRNVEINTNHIMSSIKIFIEAGDGFTAETFANMDISVNLRNVRNNAAINLADGSVTAFGDPVQMTPYMDDGFYRAIVVPQEVADGSELIVVTVNGTEYALKKGFTFVSGKRHKFTVTVNKTGSGVNVGIGGWEEDEEDNGGSAE